MKLFYFVYYATLAGVFPFLPLFLKERGFNGSEIGALMAFGPVVMIISQPLWGLVCDYLQNRIKVLLVTILGAMAMVLLFPWPGQFLAFFLLIGAYTFFQSPIIPISDSILLGYLDKSKTSYGQIRLWGSLGFTGVVILLGLTLEKFPLEFLFYGSALLFFIAFIVALKLPKEISCPKQQVLKGIGQLLTNKPFLFFLLYAFLVQWTFSAHNTFFSIYFKEIGGGSSLLGLAWAVAAASEIPVFFFTQKWLQAWGHRPLLLLAGSVYCARWFLFSVLTNPLAVVLAQGLQGISFGLFYGAAVTYVNNQVPPGLRTTGQTLFWSITFGLGASLGSLIGGMILESKGVFSLYQTAGIVCLAGVTGYALALKKTNTRPSMD